MWPSQAFLGQVLLSFFNFSVASKVSWTQGLGSLAHLSVLSPAEIPPPSLPGPSPKRLGLTVHWSPQEVCSATLSQLWERGCGTWKG